MYLSEFCILFRHFDLGHLSVQRFSIRVSGIRDFGFGILDSGNWAVIVDRVDVARSSFTSTRRDKLRAGKFERLETTREISSRTINEEIRE